MLIYKVNQGTITAVEVLRETATGWSLSPRGFIKRQSMGKYPRLSDVYYTDSFTLAMKWSRVLKELLQKRIDSAVASQQDLTNYHLNGAVGKPPASRLKLHCLVDGYLLEMGNGHE